MDIIVIMIAISSGSYIASILFDAVCWIVDSVHLFFADKEHKRRVKFLSTSNAIEVSDEKRLK